MRTQSSLPLCCRPSVWVALGLVSTAASESKSSADPSADAVRRQSQRLADEIDWYGEESVVAVTTAGRTVDTVRRQNQRLKLNSRAPNHYVEPAAFGASAGGQVHSLAEADYTERDNKSRAPLAIIGNTSSHLKLLSRDWDRLNLSAVPPPSLAQLQTAAQVSGVKRIDCETEPAALPDISIQAPNVAEERCSYLSGSVDEQLAHLLEDRSASDAPPIAWTVIDSSYSKYALDQAEQLKAVGFERMLFVTVDSTDSLGKALCHSNLQVIDFSLEFEKPPQNQAGDKLHWSTKLRVAKAKFLMPALLLQSRVSSLFTEMDIFWLQNPLIEFESAISDGHAPSLVIGAHSNNPQGPNIGTWYIPGNAPQNTAQPFQEAFEIMEAFATESNIDKPYEVFDQQVLVEVLGKRTSWAHITSPFLPRACKADKPELWCTHFSSSAVTVYDDVLVRLLDNTRISSATVPEYDSYVLAVHVLGGAPLSPANKKMSVAKLGGVFQGTPAYYEAADHSDSQTTQRRYIAWDGRVRDGRLALSDHSGALRNPGYGMSTVLPLILKLGSATGRTVILPQEVDLYNSVWPAEQLFDVDKFQLQHPTVTLRESSFLRNMRLPPDSMYPVAQLTVVEGQFGAQSWAGLKITARLGSPPSVSHIILNRTKTEGTGYRERVILEAMQALVDMMDNSQVQTAKTVLISLPLGQVEGATIDDYLTSSCASRSVQDDSLKNLFCVHELKQKAPPVLDTSSMCASKTWKASLLSGRIRAQRARLRKHR